MHHARQELPVGLLNSTLSKFHLCIVSAFQIQKKSFFIKAACIACQLTGFSYHPMTGNDNGNGVQTICSAHSPDSPGITD